MFNVCIGAELLFFKGSPPDRIKHNVQEEAAARALAARALSRCRRPPRGAPLGGAMAARGAGGIGAGRPGREELPAPRTARPGLGALPAGGRRRAGQGRAERRGWDLLRVIPPGGAAGRSRSIPPSPARGGESRHPPLPPFKTRAGGARAEESGRSVAAGPISAAGRALDEPPAGGGRQPSGSDRGAMSAGGSGSAGTATSALCLLLSLTAVAVCLLLGAKTAELQGRLAALEERGAAGPGPLLDALQPRVEQLLREVSAAGLSSGLPGRFFPLAELFPPPFSSPFWKDLTRETPPLSPSFCSPAKAIRVPKCRLSPGAMRCNSPVTNSRTGSAPLRSACCAGAELRGGAAPDCVPTSRPREVRNGPLKLSAPTHSSY